MGRGPARAVDRDTPEKAREALAAWKAGRATLKELWAAIEAIFGAAKRREEAIAMNCGVYGWIGDGRWIAFDVTGKRDRWIRRAGKNSMSR